MTERSHLLLTCTNGRSGQGPNPGLCCETLQETTTVERSELPEPIKPNEVWLRTLLFRPGANFLSVPKRQGRTI